MATKNKRVELFAGNITVNIPSDYIDASDIRQIPDHQEVFLAANGFSSIIFEVNERPMEPKTDLDALIYHANDLIDEEDDSTLQNPTEGVKMAKLPASTPVLSTSIIAKPRSLKSNPPPNTAKSNTILLNLIRLERHKTDILISHNIPNTPIDAQVDSKGQDAKTVDDAAVLKAGQEVMEEVCRSFDIKNWNLFGEDVGEK